MWIEIIRVRRNCWQNRVTPFAGVWIEIPDPQTPIKVLIVSPFAGVWIEIIHWLELMEYRMSHSLRGSVD